ncbi:hypothetical protein B0T26DRAFT_845733 [Lasiosphaeria miniovina]|uniref:Transcription factor hoxa13 n=1 Tax=Lasiosphaeria miniovina TaxID=1954250 RepID=A0AA40B399_9PEZI|nr:uncharacterized protein B0T26DRAFT_845733 [Lasiosphaeria miniovina]KAK0726713.1 hypothetical protein B0T26DRAFT_845733 [Lasiosphaeria miniovina]
MDDTNGSLKGPKPMNGINGAIKSTLNGHPVGPKKRITPSRPGFLARSLSALARLLTWYSIFTILLRCPSTLDACDETSPRICKPYFQLVQAVSPIFEPYYDAYAAPYVDIVRPYYNVVDQRVISPSWGYAKKHGAPRLQLAESYGRAQWEKSVQPQIAKYQHLAVAQYNQNLGPHVTRVTAVAGPYFEIARTNALQTYHEFLLPSYQYIQPYVYQGYAAASDFTTGKAVPSVIWAWNKTYVFLDATVWPQLRVIYVENVEPQLVKIGKRLGRYNSGKKTVPKTVTESQPSSSSKASSSFAKPSVSASSSSSSSSLSSSTTSSVATQVEEEDNTTESTKPRSTADLVPPPEVDGSVENEDPVRRTARETVAADLKDWQERYSKAADEGAAEIDERVQEITKRMVRRNARITGKSLLEQLQKSTVSGLVGLRRDIQAIVGAANKGSASPKESEEEIVKVVRLAGMAIREKALDVRAWRESYEAEMQAAITKAAETHFAILENIRDLALQKIGMKWAWMDGITYKDWAKYHLLKSRFDEWQGDLENLIVTHPNLEAAQLEGANIEDEAMNIAASAAKELARLKQVAKWKLAASDDTSEFDSTLMEQAAEAATALKDAAANLLSKAEDSAVAGKDAVAEKIEEGANLAAELVEDAKEAVKNALSTAEEQSEQAVRSASEIQSAAQASSSLGEFASKASHSVSSAGSASTEATLASEGGDSTTQQAPDLASTIILEQTPIVAGNTSELKEDGPAPIQLPVEDSDLETHDILVPTEELPVSASPSSVKPAFLGAAAQSVPSREPILEDVDDVAGVMESVRQELKSAYSAAMSRADAQYSQAISVLSVQVHGTPLPAHQKMLASVTSAYSKAVASASAGLDDALEAASHQIYGTPTTKNIIPTTIPIPSMPSIDWPSMESIESIAADRLRDGRVWAEEQFESAKIAVGLATPTPSSPASYASKFLDNARHNYYAAIGVAHVRHSEFMAAASSALSSLTATQTPTNLSGTASSIVSVASESASSAASVVSESAASAVSVVGNNLSSAASLVGESAASAASVLGENVSAAAAAGYDNVAGAADKAAESWEVVVSKISIQVYGAPTPTPWYESIFSVASDYASSVTQAAGDGAASVTSAAGSYAAGASDEASKKYSAVSSIVLELLVGKEPTFSESVLSRLYAAYETGVSSASSLASAAQATAASAADEAVEAMKSIGDNVASAASEAIEAVKEPVRHAKDEL